MLWHRPDDHAWLQAQSGGIEACASYLHEHEITAALAHPFYNVAAPLTASHRRRLAELFPVGETRNGARAKELNLPAFVYIETHGGTPSGAHTITPESTSDGRRTDVRGDPAGGDPPNSKDLRIWGGRVSPPASWADRP